jgi:transglutaminase-like putative cysteine protease
MKKLILSLLVQFSSTVLFAADGLDSLLSAQRDRAGSSTTRLFTLIEEADGARFSPAELADLRFLVAYMPLSDLASLDKEALMENVQLARQSHQQFAWGAQLTDELFRHFVLPHRVTQEPFVHGWRSRFLNELAPRVKNLSMTEAALEVNHWCHEYVSYQADDSRDQDPLTTMRAGLGRCEEEMIFSICALRSIGIPARQCYTPRWAHTDDNHAWVEVWTDGKWHYFGACEPEPGFNKAWFSEAAQRTMLVVSTAYGDYHGNEPVLRRYGRSTLINSTSVYGPTREMSVSVNDKQGKPVSGAKVVFNLYNYGGIQPLVSLETGDDGIVHLTCGKGDWIVSAGHKGLSAIAHVRASEDSITLLLDKPNKMTKLRSVDYTPPPERKQEDIFPQDSLFRCRLTYEDSVRNDFWGIWAKEANLAVNDLQMHPDSVYVVSFANSAALDGQRLLEIFRKARGNWGHLFHFLTGSNPQKSGLSAGVYSSLEQKGRFMLLDNLTDKDCRDFSVTALEDHLNRTTSKTPLYEQLLATNVTTLDSATKQRFEEYVVAPRIEYEPSAVWRGELCAFFLAHSALMSSRDDAALISWLRDSVVVEKEKDRLGPPLLPSQTLQLRRGSERDVETLYAGLCRVRGIPARFNPVSSQLERWEGTEWRNVKINRGTDAKTEAVKNGTFAVKAASDSTSQNALYNKDWAVQKWDKDHFAEIDFGFHTPFREVSWPQELPEGLYCLTSGIRRKDGSAPVSVTWFEIKAKSPAISSLKFRSSGD